MIGHSSRNILSRNHPKISTPIPAIKVSNNNIHVFNTNKNPHYAPKTLEFISNSISIPPYLRKLKISLALKNLENYNILNEKEREQILFKNQINDPQEKFEVYNSQSALIPQSSVVWHLNMGNPPSIYFGINKKCDIEILSSLLNNLTKEPLLIEDRGTFNGQNLFAMVLNIGKDNDQHVIGIGADINLPTIKVGQTMGRYLGLEEIIQIGYGSAHEISKPVSGINKAITMINLLSVMSVEYNEKIIGNAAKSLDAKDCILIQTLSQDSANVEKNCGEDKNWKEIKNQGGALSFSRNYNASIVSQVEGLKEKGIDIYLNELDIGLTEQSYLTQNLTFYSTHGLETVLHKYGLKIKNLVSSVCVDGCERITIQAALK